MRRGSRLQGARLCAASSVEALHSLRDFFRNYSLARATTEPYVAAVPSLGHATLLYLFQNRPELAPGLLRDVLGVEVPEYSSVRVESAELTDIVPADYRADLVVLLIDGKPVLAIVVEVQLTKDDRKIYTWPVYVVGLRARFECPAVVLVVTPEPAVARWANRPIAIGPGASLCPWVIGPDAVPVVTDRRQAEISPEFAVLSVMAHGRDDVDTAMNIALAAMYGVSQLTDARFVLYGDLILAVLSDAAREALKMSPEGYKFQSLLIRDSIEKGLVQGREEGRAEGRAEEKARCVLDVLETRGVPVSPELRTRITTCSDLEQLTQWLRRAVTVTTADELITQ